MVAPVLTTVLGHAHTPVTAFEPPILSHHHMAFNPTAFCEERPVPRPSHLAARAHPPTMASIHRPDENQGEGFGEGSTVVERIGSGTWQRRGFSWGDAAWESQERDYKQRCSIRDICEARIREGDVVKLWSVGEMVAQQRVGEAYPGGNWRDEGQWEMQRYQDWGVERRQQGP